MKPITVLSLFDGIASARIALQKAGVPVDKYYASEIDKYAIKVAQNNWPNITQLGDVTNWRKWGIDWGSIDLVCAGCPCQSFSLMGNQKGFKDERGNLMLVFIDILEEAKRFNPNVKFLLENVKMKPEYLNKISEMIGEEWIKINSDTCVPQSRTRYYWSNFIWKPVKYADDCAIDEFTEEAFCQDCEEDYAECDCVGPHESEGVAYSEDGEFAFRMPSKEYSYLDILESNFDFLPATARKGNPRLVQLTGETFGCLTASYYKGIRSDGRPAIAKGTGVFDEMVKKGEIRMLTPLECERLQGIPDNYSEGVSKTQRYKVLGNSWTTDVIAHIFKNIA